MELPDILTDKVIGRGCILHYSGFEGIDHGKFFVVLGVYDNILVGFSFINSNINRNVIRTQEQLELQFPILHTDYPFLTHASFICASDIEQYSFQYLISAYRVGKIKYMGELNAEHLDQLLEACRNSRIISNIDKKRFLY